MPDRLRQYFVERMLIKFFGFKESSPKVREEDCLQVASDILNEKKMDDLRLLSELSTIREIEAANERTGLH